MRTFRFQQRVIPIAGRIGAVFLHLAGAKQGAGFGELLGADVLTVLPQALPAIGQVFDEMPDGELETLTRELLSGATCKVGNAGFIPLFGSPGGDAFDSLMQGRTLEIWQLLWHALQVWYPDFFARARSLKDRSAEKGQDSEASNTSPGNTPGGA